MKIRLLNFIIDSIVVLAIIMIASYFLVDYVSINEMKICGIIFYYFYYFFSELVFDQTVGKIITRHKVVSCITKQKPSFVQIFLRTISRLIPVDSLSYLFRKNGLHDILSKTELKKIT